MLFFPKSIASIAVISGAGAILFSDDIKISNILMAICGGAFFADLLILLAIYTIGNV